MWFLLGSYVQADVPLLPALFQHGERDASS